MGDVVFTVVREVVSDSLGGLLTGVLGLESRSSGGDTSLLGSVMRALAKIGQDGHC